MACGRQDKCPFIPLPFCCAYGPLTLIPLIFALGSLLFTLFVTFDCRYVESISLTVNGEVSYSLGPWMIQNLRLFNNATIDESGQIRMPQSGYVKQGGCRWWGEHNYFTWSDADWPLVMSRYTSMLACLFGLTVTSFLLLSTCVKYPRGCMSIISFCSFTCALLIGLTMIIIQTKYCSDAFSCQMDQDAWVALAGTGSWLVSGVTIIFLPAFNWWGPPPPKDGKPVVAAVAPLADAEDEGETTETVDTYMNEKTGVLMKVTTTVTEYKNGNKQITEVRCPHDPYASVQMDSIITTATSEETGGLVVREEKKTETPPPIAPADLEQDERSMFSSQFYIPCSNYATQTQGSTDEEQPQPVEHKGLDP